MHGANMLIDVTQYINTQKLQQLPKVLGLLFVLLIAYTLAQLTWRIVFDSAENTTIPILSVIQQTSTSQQINISALADTIAELSLFGKAAQVIEDAAAEKIIDAPVTDLNLKLMGILATGDEEGLAIIANGNEEKLYKIGDKILGNVTLKQVYPERVILETSRGLETLKLPLERGEGFSFINNAALPTNLKERSVQAPVSRPPPIEQKLDNYRKRFIRDPASISDLADVQPITNEQDGKFIGFQLTPKTDNELFEKIGLKQGDIITDVNGVKLDQPSRGFNALRKLMNARELNITVLRNGQETVLKQEFGR